MSPEKSGVADRWDPKHGERTRTLAQRFRRLSLIKKAMLANSAVVLFGAVAGTYLTVRFARDHSGLMLALGFSIAGALVTIIVNYLAFWGHFRPLLELSRALEAIRDGQQARRAIDGVRASGLADLVASVQALLDSLEDKSLHFSARLLGSIEAERQRIGRELHDNTSQLLATGLLKIGLGLRQLTTAPAAARESLLSAHTLVAQAYDQIKAAVYDLRPAMLDDLGLAAALRWYVNARAGQNGIEVVTDLDVERRLPPPFEIALYRVGQEAVANAVRHSGASRIEVGLEIKPGYAVLRVADNGKGFDLAEARGRGLGLLSMRERVGELGGTFNIVTDPNAGTQVFAMALLPAPEAEVKA